MIKRITNMASISRVFFVVVAFMLGLMTCEVPPQYALSHSDANSYLSSKGYVICAEVDCEGYEFDCGSQLQAYKDKYCEAQCGSDPCLHSGTCFAGIYGFKCGCMPGFTGATCNTNIDDCEGPPCLNKGTCQDGINSFRCDCQAGYTGIRCQTDINECGSSPCIHGTCKDEINNFSCLCYAGYTGTRCETDIDECASSPCANGATCTDDVNSFYCTCPPKYYGRLCDTNVCHPTPADVVFLLDSSVSMTEKQFNKQLEFVANFTDQVFIGPEDFQISVITFSFDANIEFYLNNYTTNETLKAAIMNITYKPGATFTHKALEMVPLMFHSENGGKRLLNGTSPDRFVFLLTDGMSTDRSETNKMADEIKNKCQGRFQIYSIGIGNEVSHEELLYVASKPSLVYSAKDFDSLFTVLKKLVQLTCDECYRLSISDVALFVDTSHDVGFKQIDDARDILTYLSKMVDLGVDETRLSLTSYNSAISTVCKFSNDLDRLLLDIHTLQLSDSKNPTVDMVDLLTHVSTAAFEDARPNSKLVTIILTDGRFKVQDHNKMIKLRDNLSLKNITVVFIGIGESVDLYHIYSIAADTFDVYLANTNDMHNLDVIKSYMSYTVCQIED